MLFGIMEKGKPGYDVVKVLDDTSILQHDVMILDVIIKLCHLWVETYTIKSLI